MLYRAEDKVGKFAGTSRIGLAVSADGFTFAVCVCVCVFVYSERKIDR
jgi:hypothetical protein